MAKRARPRNGRAGPSPVIPKSPILTTSLGTGSGRNPATWTPPARTGGSLAVPSPEAVALFERAMQALHRRCYQDAGDLFLRLIDEFPAEPVLRDRARVYADRCGREVARTPARPVTVEERVTAATAALNNAQEEEAERLALSVLDERPDHDLALYLVAAVHARRGEATSALEWLTRAMEASPDVRAQARHDSDFEPLRALEAFRLLLDTPTLSAQSRNVRLRQARSER